MVITSIKLDEILGYHESVKSMLAETTPIMYKLGPHECTSLFLHNLLRLHPLHLFNTKNGYQLIAGFRAYEIAKLIWPTDSVIPCIVHDKSTLSDTEIENLAISDLLGSPLLFQFAKDYAQNINKVKNSIDKKRVKEIFKDISSKQKIDARNYDTL